MDSALASEGGETSERTKAKAGGMLADKGFKEVETVKPQPRYTIVAKGKTSAAVAPRISTLRCSYDKIEIVSPAWPGTLWKNLPIKQLRREAHSFDIKSIINKHSPFKSRIILVCPPNDLRALQRLNRNRKHLFRHAVVVAEVAADQLVPSEDQAQANHLASIETVRKRRHVRGYVYIAHDKKQRTPPKGIIEGPTLYYERGTSSMAFKSYCRYDKAAVGQFTNQAVTRYEFTVKGSAIKRHLGGNQISNLLNANLPTFVRKQLKLEHVDHAAVGRLLMPSVNRPRHWPANDPNFWARQVAFRVLRHAWYRAMEDCSDCTASLPCGKHQLALRVWQLSPAQVRGFLRDLKNGKRAARRRGRPTAAATQRRRPITVYRINCCFY